MIGPLLDERPLRSISRVAAERLIWETRRYPGGSIHIDGCTGGDIVCSLDIENVEGERGEFKAEFHADMRPHFFWAVHRRAKHMIEEAHLNGITRVWCAVDASDDNGHRWLRALGFEPEGLMRKYAKGRDYVLYAKVR